MQLPAATHVLRPRCCCCFASIAQVVFVSLPFVPLQLLQYKSAARTCFERAVREYSTTIAGFEHCWLSFGLSMRVAVSLRLYLPPVAPSLFFHCLHLSRCPFVSLARIVRISLQIDSTSKFANFQGEVPTEYFETHTLYPPGEFFTCDERFVPMTRETGNYY